MAGKRNHHRRSKRRMPLWLILLGLIGVGVAIDVLLIANQVSDTGLVDMVSALPSATSRVPTVSPSSEAIPITPSPSATPDSVILPDKASVTIPFLVQAPFAKWDALHEDACEEASVIMVKHFLDKTSISAKSGDNEIIAMVQYEENTGYGPSITLQDLKTVSEKHYGMKGGRIQYSVTTQDMKRELAAGHPVIVPAAGKILPNPHFSNGGPVYHMLVLKGYDEQGFITNDPGVKSGEGFRYAYDDLFRAIHDWNPQNILDGTKAYLVFE